METKKERRTSKRLSHITLMVETVSADCEQNVGSDGLSEPRIPPELPVELPPEDPESVTELSAVLLPPESEVSPPALPGVEPTEELFTGIPVRYTPDWSTHNQRGLYQNHRIHNHTLNIVQPGKHTHIPVTIPILTL